MQNFSHVERWVNRWVKLRYDSQKIKQTVVFTGVVLTIIANKFRWIYESL